ncbi:MAG: hypothetical protein WAU82_19780 [Candidatus Binatus sp.]|uniref:hypothetical protein n=1 Tax=Candidatus Binatus sp. TaxID=2811406 RepID=UPI003BB1530B
MNNTHPNPDSPEALDTALPALSPRQLAARRANALKSTGPRTSEGKETARLNALKHGFFSCDVVNSELDGSARVDEFNAMLDALLEEFKPESVHERMMIDELAACCWRIRRLLRYECRETWSDEDEARRAARTETPSEAIASIMGYDRQAARQRTARKFRRAGLDVFSLPCDSDIDKIVRYERLIKRNLYRALYTLERIRAARRQSASSDPNQSSPASLSHERELLDENKF